MLVLGLVACGGDDPGEPIGTNGMQEGGVAATAGTTAGTGGTTDSTANTAGTTGTTDPNTDIPLGPMECAAISRESPEAKGGVDVIFLLDTSGSMLHAIQQVTANLAQFIQDFEGTDADTHVVMITGNDPAAGSPVASQPDRYRFIQSEVDSSALYSVALAQFPNYQDFLRPTAATQFVMITDDNDDIPPDSFRMQMEALLGRGFTQHAIASEDFNGTPCYSESIGCPVTPGIPPIPALCGAIAIGETYNALAAQTGGVQSSVCTADWTPVFEQLKSAVIEAVPLPCDYPLTDASSDHFDKNKVQVFYRSEMAEETQFRYSESGIDGCGEETRWYYDDPTNPTTIHLCPMACEKVSTGGSIDLVFGCPPLI